MLGHGFTSDTTRPRRTSDEACTSRPSQNSVSVIWPLMTNSRWSAASSGVLTRTFLRMRKSWTGSFTGVPRVLETDSAREVDGRDGAGAGARFAAPLAGDGAVGALVCGDCSPPPSRAARLLLMMVVSCALNDSRSASARGEVKVKLWPLLSFSRPTLRRT